MDRYLIKKSGDGRESGTRIKKPFVNENVTVLSSSDSETEGSEKERNNVIGVAGGSRLRKSFANENVSILSSSDTEKEGSEKQINNIIGVAGGSRLRKSSSVSDLDSSDDFQCDSASSGNSSDSNESEIDLSENETIQQNKNRTPSSKKKNAHGRKKIISGRVHKNYKQKARSLWLNNAAFKDWVELLDNKEIVKCKYCSCNIKAKVSSMKDHVKSKKHQLYAEPFTSKVNVISFKKIKSINKTKISEARFALFVAKHTSIRTVDHVTLVCKSCFDDHDVVAQMKLGRTKCSAIIKNVWAPFLIKMLIKDIGNEPFSIIIDESTDIGVIKHVGFVIRYYSKTNTTIVNTFLKLAQLEKCTATNLALLVKEVLNEFGLQMKNLVGIGTDNANVMVGVNNGLHAKLKQDIPNLVLIPCVCHSLQLAISDCCKRIMPRGLEFLISETYNWFSRSSSRQSTYLSIYRAINDGHDPLKIVQSSDTRWLSVEPATSRILSQWIELKTHFNMVRMTEKCYGAEQLYNLYCDEFNKAYLLFLQPHLKNVQRVNKIFEGNANDPTKMINDLSDLLTSTVYTVVNERHGFDPFTTSVSDYLVPNPYLGYEFENQMKFIRQKKLGTDEDEKLIRKRCIDFIINLVYQLRQRLPNNIKILKQLNLFSVENALKVVKEPIIPILEEFNVNPGIISSIELQWKNLTTTNWNEKESTLKFGTEVNMYTDAAGNNPFKELVEFVFRLLVLPLSNAEVERLFSQMNLIKTKIRNRTHSNMLNAIIMVRSSMKLANKCCYNFDVPKDVYEQIGSKSIYKIGETDEDVDYILDILPDSL